MNFHKKCFTNSAVVIEVSAVINFDFFLTLFITTNSLVAVTEKLTLSNAYLPLTNNFLWSTEWS